MTILSTLLPPGEIQFVDGNGSPYSAGQVHYYIPNTTAPKNTWKDPGQMTLNTNPVILDSAGRATIYGTGQYTMALYDVNNVLVYTALTSADPLTGAFIKFDTNGNFTVNVGPNLFADTTGRLVVGFNVTSPTGTSYTMTDNDRGATIGTEGASGTLTVNLPSPATVMDGYYALFHRGGMYGMTISSSGSNIYTTQYGTGTSSLSLPNPQSFIGLYVNSGNWLVWCASADMTYQSQSSLVYSETPQAVSNNTDTPRTWTTALNDALGLWSAGNPTRLTVPTGATKVRLSGNTQWQSTSATGNFNFTFWKNGALFTGTPHLTTTSAGSAIFMGGNITSPDLFVTGGDYFEMAVLQNTGGSLSTENAVAGINWFSMEILQWG